jgi:transposase
MVLPLVCTPLPPASVADRFATPPWDRDSPDWQRLDQKLAPDHLARQVDRAVDQLDLRPLYASYGGTGSLAWRPDLLLKVVLFEMQRGHRSPAQWYEDLHEHEPCQWLAFGMCPSRSRLYAFRDRLGPLLDGWHNQLLGGAVTEGLTAASQTAMDGSTVAALGSRHRLLNEETLAKRQQALDEAITAEATGCDATDVPGWMAATPSGRVQQQQRYQQAQTQLAARLQENQARPASKRLEAKNVRVSPGDPEAALGLDKLKVYRPLYTVQLMPDLDTPLILAWELFAQATDAATLPTMLERCRQATGHYPKDALTDAAYATALDLAACAQAGVTLYAPYQSNDASATRPAKKPPKQIPKEKFAWQELEQVYVCPQGHRLSYAGAEYERRKGGERLRMACYRCAAEHCTGCPRQKDCTRSPGRGRMVKRSEHEGLVEALKARMQTDAAKQLYKKRCQVVELNFADAKEHRGLRRFSGRGKTRARLEVGLLVLAHNALAVLALRDKKKDPTPRANPESASG